MLRNKPIMYALWTKKHTLESYVNTKYVQKV